MKQVFVALLSVYLLLLIPTSSFAETAPSATPSVHDRIAQETKDFDPEKVGAQLEGKGNEIMDIAKGGSFLYVAIALCLFVVLLLGGLIYRPLLKMAFLVLILALFAFLLIQNWQAVLNGIKSFFHWLGSNSEQIVPGNETIATPEATPV